MKRLFLSAVMLLPIVLMAQSDFTLSGTTKSLENGAKVYLRYGRKIDSAIINKGKFEFKGRANATVQGYLMNRSGRATDSKILYIEPGDITAYVATNLKSSVIGGTPSNIDNAKLDRLLQPFADQENAHRTELRKLSKAQQREVAVGGMLSNKINTVIDKKSQAILKFVKDNPNSFISLLQLIILAKNDKIVDEVEKLYASLSTELRAQPVGLTIPSTTANTRKIAVGAMAMDFTQNDPDGKPVKLSDFKGKYVLLDFWAAWCRPCRAENPNVVEAFTKFKDKNFTVFGVSLDGGSTKTTKEQWLKAISDDQLDWAQVSDLNGWANEAAVAWGIKAIPTNFLIDPRGKIIAKNLRDSELHLKLAEILEKEK